MMEGAACLSFPFLYQHAQPRQLWPGPPSLLPALLCKQTNIATNTSSFDRTLHRNTSRLHPQDFQLTLYDMNTSYHPALHLRGDLRRCNPVIQERSDTPDPAERKGQWCPSTRSTFQFSQDPPEPSEYRVTRLPTDRKDRYAIRQGRSTPLQT